jgi:hypothetical protein
MPISNITISLFASFAIASVGLADKQVPPLPVKANEECHIDEATPLLDKKSYTANNYKLETLKQKPLVLRETAEINKNIDVTIEQRGCEDIEIKFNFALKNKTTNPSEALTQATQTLRDFKLSSEALINTNQLTKIADAVERKRKGTKKIQDMNGAVICMSEVDAECITDVLVKFADKSVDLTYIDRP